MFLLLSKCHAIIKFSVSFLIMYPNNFNCLFLVLSKKCPLRSAGIILKRRKQYRAWQKQPKECIVKKVFVAFGSLSVLPHIFKLFIIMHCKLHSWRKSTNIIEELPDTTQTWRRPKYIRMYDKNKNEKIYLSNSWSNEKSFRKKLYIH